MQETLSLQKCASRQIIMCLLMRCPSSTCLMHASAALQASLQAAILT